MLVAKKSKKVQRVELVGDICLYGARHCGFAYYASRHEPEFAIIGKGGWNEAEDGLSGKVTSLTEAVFSACRDLRAVGVETGTIRVFAPGGDQYGDISVSNPPNFGSIDWKRAA